MPSKDRGAIGRCFCGHVIQTKRALIGRQVRCPQCSAAIRLETANVRDDREPPPPTAGPPVTTARDGHQGGRRPRLLAIAVAALLSVAALALWLLSPSKELATGREIAALIPGATSGQRERLAEAYVRASEAFEIEDGKDAEELLRPLRVAAEHGMIETLGAVPKLEEAVLRRIRQLSSLDAHDPGCVEQLARVAAHLHDLGYRDEARCFSAPWTVAIRTEMRLGEVVGDLEVMLTNDEVRRLVKERGMAPGELLVLYGRHRPQAANMEEFMSLLHISIQLEEGERPGENR